LSKVQYVKDPSKVEEDGSYTGTRYMETASERPGILPTIARVALPRILFASLQDMGLPLPEYDEKIVWLQLDPAMKAQYVLADGAGRPPYPHSLYEWAVDELKEQGNRGALAVWLTTALNRPNAMFRDETVIYNRRISGRGKYALRRKEEVMHLPAVTDVSPKDEWLVERCLAERAEGRKVLVFVRQTGKRDIQPHIAEILRSHGLRVGVLSPSVSPRRRVAWITKHAPNLDVLLTNARLVKVGLNLRMFATAVFYEIEWSLSILWQAMRRVYRPGAPLPVRVFFPVYEGTLEEQAINLIGQKMKAAQLFYGDEVASALTDEDEGDFLNDLVRQVLSGGEIARTDAVFATAAAQVAAVPVDIGETEAEPAVVPEPIEAETAPAPAPVTLDGWLAQFGTVQPKPKRRRRVRVPEGQLALF